MTPPEDFLMWITAGMGVWLFYLTLWVAGLARVIGDELRALRAGIRRLGGE